MKKDDAPKTNRTDTDTVTVILKKDHWHRGLLIPAGARLDLLPHQAAALKAADVAG